MHLIRKRDVIRDESWFSLKNSIFLYDSKYAHQEYWQIQEERRKSRYINGNDPTANNKEKFTPFIIPTIGVLELELEVELDVNRDVQLVNKTGFMHYKQLLKDNSKDPTEILSILCMDMKLTGPQARELIQLTLSIMGGKSSVSDRELLMVYETILLCLIDSTSVTRLVYFDLSSKQSYALIDEMGYSLLVLANALNGYYHLNIDKKLDRWTALQLAKINACERRYMKDQTLKTWGSGHYTFGLYVGTPKNPYGHGEPLKLNGRISK